MALDDQAGGGGNGNGGGSPATDSGGEPTGVPGAAGTLSAEERALLGALTNILNIQAQHLQNQTTLFANLMPSYQDLFLAQNAYQRQSLDMLSKAMPVLAAEAVDLYERYLRPMSEVSETERLATENVNKYLRGETLLTGQDVGRLDTIFGRVREAGTANIRQFAEESAAARGLKLTDTPIGSESLQQVREFESDLGASRAEAELGIEESRGRFAEASRQFGTNLRAAAIANRAALVTGFLPGYGGQGIGSGTSLPTVGGPDTGGAFSFLSNASNQRASAANLAASQSFSGSQADLDRQNRLDVANVSRRGRTPGALDYVSAFAPTVAGFF